MQEIFNKFKIRILPETIQRVQMDDETYFGPEYSDYISNSKLGLLNPAQGGSPQLFLEGFKSSGSSALALGSAVHQLTLEPNDYILSDITKPAAKVGLVYDNYLKFREKNYSIEKSLTLAALEADYYTNKINEFKGDGLPPVLQNLISVLLRFKILSKEKEKDGKKLIYLPSDLYSKCVSCVNSIRQNDSITSKLNKPLSYCEDVILGNLEVQFPKDFYNDDSEIITVTIKLKIKIDNWTIDLKNSELVLNDLKTTGAPIQNFMGHEEIEFGPFSSNTKVFVPGSFQKFSYYRQMGMYLFLLREYAKIQYKQNFKCYANMLVVETVGAHNSISYPVSNNDVVYGFNEFVQLVKRIAYHEHYGYDRILEFERRF